MSHAASAKVKITNRLGLHARPAMMVAETAMKYQAQITLRRCDQSEAVDGKSIMQLMMLAATQGTELEITATGHADAADAVKELVELVQSNFQEE